MKKRLLSALLALALVFVLLPTTALAEVTTGKDYDISINGKGWKFEKDTPVYFYGYDPSNYFFSTTADHQWTTNSNLMLTKEGNTVTITIRPSKYRPNESPEFNLKKESTSTEQNDVPCIKMGNDNNLVITGKGTLNITRNENKSYGAALYSNVGDITINGGITVNVSFLNGKDYYNKNVSSNAIYVGDNHNLTVSGSGTNVIATNQGFHSSPATVCVEGGTITVSGGASLSATNTYDDNRSGSDDVKIQHFNSYAISGTKSNPCTLIVADEKSSVTATTNDFTNIAESWAFKYTTIQAAGATIKAGSSVSNSTVTTIDNISGQRYAKISIPALETTADVLIAKENAVVGVRTSLGEGNGYYTYNKDTKTLTLEDVSITNVAHFIQFWAKDSYTIELKGTNTITGVTSAIRVPEKGYNNESLDGLNVTITGTGSLNVTANTYAIDMQVGNLIFNSTGNITLTTNTNYLVQATVRNALHVAGKITIDKAKYDIVGVKQDKDGTREDISDNPNLDTILKGTSTEKDLYFKSITITPAAAKDSTISYNRKTLKQGGIITGENGGTATVDSKNNTITLDNFKGNYPLEFNAEFTPNSITLIGDSTLSAVETKYQNLTISGSGSLTVGSIRVPNNTQNTANLTITGGAHVTVNRPSGEDEPAVEVSGNLTVTGDGTQLSAECTAATNPAIEVGGNVTISGNPGTNAYTVKAYNKYATPRGRDDKLRPSQMPSAIEISGDSLSISNSAQVMAKTDSDGAAVWMPKQKVISVVDASLIAQNRSHNFSTISFGDESNMGNIYAKGQVNIVAENMLGSNSRLAHRAIKAYIYNHYSTGDSNPYYIKVVSEGVQSGGNVNVIPGDCTSTGGYKVTITRGDAYVAPTKTITEIIVTGLTPPVKGATPVDKSKVTLTDGLTVESITWGPALTSDGKFAANTAYTAHINYSVKAGYELAANANCPQVAGANVTRWHQEGMPQDEIEVTFPKTAADTPTEKPTITLDLPAPVAGVAPVTTGVTATSSDNTPLTIDKVEWYAYTVEYNNGKFERIVEGDKVSGNFEANTYYFAEITFDRSIYFANEGLNIIAPTWPLEGSWPESRIYRVIENSYTARILFPATDAACNHQPGDWQDGTDGEHHVKVCAICHNVVATESHAFGGYQINTNNSHTRVCSVCNAAYTNAHEFNSYAHNENSHWKVCVCGATTSYANHEFDPATGACACGATQSGGNPTPDVPAAPTGLAGVAPTSANSKDGKITGTTAAMEYATEPNGSNWIECGGDEVTGLSAGTYYVRYKRTTDKPASAVATVVVPAYSGGGEIVPPTPDNPGTIVIIRPAEEEKPAQQPNPSTGANDLVGLAVAAAVAAALGSAALLRKHD